MNQEVPTVVDESAESTESAEDGTIEVNTPDNGADDGDDVEEAVVDLTEDDLGGGLFDGVEDDESAAGENGESGDESGSGESDGSEDSESADDVLDVDASAIEDAINGGMARVGVFGLAEDDLEDHAMTKDELEEEFRATFEMFQLGRFGSRFAEEYILKPADGDIDPTWGLLGTTLMACGMIVWMRPDGDRAVEKIRDVVGNLGGGSA